MEALATDSSFCVRCGTPPSGIVRFCSACWQDLVALLRGPTSTPAPRQELAYPGTRARPGGATERAEARRRATDG